MAPQVVPLKFAFIGAKPPAQATDGSASTPSAPENGSGDQVMPGSEVASVLFEVLGEKLSAVSCSDDEDVATLAAEAAKAGGLLALMRGRSKDGGAWCVMDTDKAEPPDDADASAVVGWRLQLKESQDQHSLEILGQIRRLLLNAGVDVVRPLVANGEHLLLLDSDAATAAARALLRAGHGLFPAPRVTPAPDDEALSAEHAEKLCGVWRLVRTRRKGDIDHVFSSSEAPLRIQAPTGVWVEVRIARPGQVAGQASCCGTARVASASSGGGLVVERYDSVSFEPPSAGPREYQVAFETGGGERGEDVCVETSRDEDDEVVERWHRIAKGPVTVLELTSIDPKPIGGEHGGHWLFCGSHWLRVTGLRQGEGLLASTCCASHALAQQLHGAEAVDSEIREQFRASCGLIPKPGLLTVTREAWSRIDEPKVLFDAAKAPDDVRRDDDIVVHAPRIGALTAWDVRCFDMDPFTPPAPKSKGKEKQRRSNSSGSGDDSASEKEKAGASSDDSSEKPKKKEQAKKKKDRSRDKSDDSSKSRGRKDRKRKDAKKKKSSSDSSRKSSPAKSSPAKKPKRARSSSSSSGAKKKASSPSRARKRSSSSSSASKKAPPPKKKRQVKKRSSSSEQSPKRKVTKRSSSSEEKVVKKRDKKKKQKAKDSDSDSRRSRSRKRSQSSNGAFAKKKKKRKGSSDSDDGTEKKAKQSNGSDSDSERAKKKGKKARSDSSSASAKTKNNMRNKKQSDSSDSDARTKPKKNGTKAKKPKKKAKRATSSNSDASS
eukprot:TRINITY_DN15027_c0_g1_i1.p1 TRINITY_DN15027_c0_g1~~TRINITY_DN15027_c0_g1_i1.p1  ORF type:complete len:774 (+),score=191.61 TRINITY_DN15027_c0_g1_i1:172-2493(+)